MPSINFNELKKKLLIEALRRNFGVISWEEGEKWIQEIYEERRRRLEKPKGQ